MTIKEIADVVGRDERSIRNWVVTAGERNDTADFLDKMATSSPKHPADFSEKEVFEILKAGLGEKVAAVYMYNAAIAKNYPVLPTTRDDLVVLITETISTILPKMFDKFEKYIDKKVSKLQVVENKTNSSALENRLSRLENLLSNPNNETTSIPLITAKEMTVDLNFKNLKKPYLAINTWRGKKFIEGVFDVDDIFSFNDRVCIKYLKDKIVIEKSNNGFLLYLRDKTRKRTSLSFKHTFSSIEKAQLPFELPDDKTKIVINGISENDTFVFYYSDMKVMEKTCK